MTDRRERIKELFHEALELAPGERAAFLERACRDDPDVRRQIDAMLAAEEQAETLLGAAPAEKAAVWQAVEHTQVAAGERIGPYRILAPLGAGGMGEVYLAHDERLERRIALKLLPASVSADNERIGRFQQEARAAARLAHPNVCVIHDVGVTEDGRHYIAMEYVEGETLRARMARSRMELDQVLTVTGQVAAALGAAHASGIVHRDVKPENVMLRPDGYTKVLDFGLAKLIERPESPELEVTTRALVRTASDMVMGTVAYMSPEQARGHALDARTDLWSLGVVLYELVAGRHPFAGETAADLMVSILRTEPEPLSVVAPDAPAELARIVGRTLSKPLDGRYQTAVELALDLERVRAELAFARRHASAAGPDVSSVTMILHASPEHERPGAPPQEWAAAGPIPPTQRLPEPPLVGRDQQLVSAEAPTVPNNLSHTLTSFVGREREVADVGRRLESVRLVTLTGAGGIGKTRLALRVAAGTLALHPGGVWFVDLSSVGDASALPGAFAAALGVREQPGEALATTVVGHLHPRHALLVVDNCEHLVEECSAFVDRLLRSCPTLTVLATSREALGVAGELVWPLAPLTVPPDGSGPTDASGLLEYEAVALFRDRAALAKPTFDVTDQNAAAVADVCRRLDGIPLAIELAAVRVKAIPLEQIASRLGDRLSFLTRGARTAAPRQQTLRATIDWSHDLLSDEERALFRRLAVFGGGWTLAAAEAVCARGAVELEDVPDLVEQLVDKSLVMLAEGEAGPRYRMLESIHQYAGEKLADAGEDEWLRRSHRDWFAAFAERGGGEIVGPHTYEWIVRLDADRRNLDAALLWSRAEGDVEAVFRIAKSLSFFWYLRGYWGERVWFEELLSRDDLASESRAEALGQLGGFAYVTGDYGRAEALERESLELKRSLANVSGVVGTLIHLGAILQIQGDMARARACYDESLSLSEELNKPRGVATALRSLGELAIAEANFDLAEEMLMRAAEVFTPPDETFDVLNFIPLDLAEIARVRGDYTRAASLVTGILADVRARGIKHTLGVALCRMGDITRDAGRTTEAVAHYLEALVINEELGDRVNFAWALGGLANVGPSLGYARESLRLAGAAAAIRARCRVPISTRDAEEIERYLAPARAELGVDDARRAFDEGAGLSQADARRLAESLAR